jgi:hypothetical protein
MGIFHDANAPGRAAFVPRKEFLPVDAWQWPPKTSAPATAPTTTAAPATTASSTGATTPTAATASRAIASAGTTTPTGATASRAIASARPTWPASPAAIEHRSRAGSIAARAPVESSTAISRRWPAKIVFPWSWRWRGLSITVKRTTPWRGRWTVRAERGFFGEKAVSGKPRRPIGRFIHNSLTPIDRQHNVRRFLLAAQHRLEGLAQMVPVRRWARPTQNRLSKSANLIVDTLNADAPDIHPGPRGECDEDDPRHARHQQSDAQTK